MEYGYARISTKKQNEQRQLIALQEFGIENSRIYVDKQSGKNFERTQYQWLLHNIRCGDTLVVKSIDRLGRNYEEILEQWRIITGTLIADIVLQLLSYVAQAERDFIHQRQAEGIAAAKQQGIKFGRKPMERPEEYKRLKRQWQNGKVSARGAARQLGVTHRTFLLWVNADSDG